MRKHFLLGIIGQMAEPAPVDMADYIIQWEPELIIGIKYCPFCGKEIQRGEVRRLMV